MTIPDIQQNPSANAPIATLYRKDTIRSAFTVPLPDRIEPAATITAARIAKPRVPVLREPFSVAGLHVEPQSGTLTRSDGSMCPLERRPMQVLQILAAAQGSTVSRRGLVSAIWADERHDNALTAAVSRLRRRLGDTRVPRQIIETVPRSGYRLRASVTRGASQANQFGPSRLQAAFSELSRRRVVRVTSGYAVIGWLIAQIAEVMFEPLGVPAWYMSFLVWLLLLGFPVVVVLSWVLQVTDHGVELDKPMAVEPRSRRLRVLIYLVSTVLLMGITVLGYRWALGLEAPAATETIVPLSGLPTTQTELLFQPQSQQRLS